MHTLVNSNEIPIIDLGLHTPNDTLSDAQIDKLSKDLDHSLSEHGSALLINYGIPEEKFENLSEIFQKFLKFPNSIKDKYERTNNQGYFSNKGEMFSENQIEIRDTFSIGGLHQDFFPELHVPGFRNQVVNITNDFHSLMTLIVKCLAKSLNFSEEKFLKMHSFLTDDYKLGSAFRIIHYPKIDENVNNQNGIRCGAHYDYGSFTLLWQDSEGGLEILHPSTKIWRRVGHLPGALLINVAEMLETWSEKRYPAILHRVVVPEEESIRNRARNSLIFFVCGELDAPIAPISVVKSENEKELEKYITGEQHMQKKFSEYYK